MTYNSPFGPLRIDYGVSINDKNLNQLHFGLGYSLNEIITNKKFIYNFVNENIRKYLAIFKNTQLNTLLIVLLMLYGCDTSSSPEKLFSKANVERSQSNFKKQLRF